MKNTGLLYVSQLRINFVEKDIVVIDKSEGTRVKLFCLLEHLDADIIVARLFSEEVAMQHFIVDVPV